GEITCCSGLLRVRDPRSEPKCSAALTIPESRTSSEGLGLRALVESSETINGNPERQQRDPHILDFAEYHSEAPTVEKPFHSDRRDSDGPPREEITGGIKRREEGDSQAAVGHRVQHPVRSCCEEKESKQCPPSLRAFFNISERP